MKRTRIEFEIGTKFHCDNHLIEVIEDKKISKNGKCEYTSDCNGCFFNNRVVNFNYCEIVKCFDFERNDEKSIVFKEVEK